MATLTMVTSISCMNVAVRTTPSAIQRLGSGDWSCPDWVMGGTSYRFEGTSENGARETEPPPPSLANRARGGGRSARCGGPVPRGPSIAPSGCRWRGRCRTRRTRSAGLGGRPPAPCLDPAIRTGRRDGPWRLPFDPVRENEGRWLRAARPSIAQREPAGGSCLIHCNRTAGSAGWSAGRRTTDDLRPRDPRPGPTIRHTLRTAVTARFGHGFGRDLCPSGPAGPFERPRDVLFPALRDERVQGLIHHDLLLGWGNCFRRWSRPGSGRGRS